MKKAIILLIIAFSAISCSKLVTPKISLSETTIFIPKDGGSFEMDITSNYPWTYKVEGSLIQSSDNNYGVVVEPASWYGDKHVKVTVPPSTLEYTDVLKLCITAAVDKTTYQTVRVLITQESK